MDIGSDLLMELDQVHPVLQQLPGDFPPPGPNFSAFACDAQLSAPFPAAPSAHLLPLPLHPAHPYCLPPTSKPPLTPSKRAVHAITTVKLRLHAWISTVDLTAGAATIQLHDEHLTELCRTELLRYVEPHGLRVSYKVESAAGRKRKVWLPCVTADAAAQAAFLAAHPEAVIKAVPTHLATGAPHHLPGGFQHPQHQHQQQHTQLPMLRPPPLPPLCVSSGLRLGTSHPQLQPPLQPQQMWSYGSSCSDYWTASGMSSGGGGAATATPTHCEYSAGQPSPCNSALRSASSDAQSCFGGMRASPEAPTPKHATDAQAVAAAAVVAGGPALAGAASGVSNEMLQLCGHPAPVAATTTLQQQHQQPGLRQVSSPSCSQVPLHISQPDAYWSGRLSLQPRRRDISALEGELSGPPLATSAGGCCAVASPMSQQKGGVSAAASLMVQQQARGCSKPGSVSPMRTRSQLSKVQRTAGHDAPTSVTMACSPLQPSATAGGNGATAAAARRRPSASAGQLRSPVSTASISCDETLVVTGEESGATAAGATVGGSDVGPGQVLFPSARRAIMLHDGPPPLTDAAAWHAASSATHAVDAVPAAAGRTRNSNTGGGGRTPQSAERFSQPDSDAHMVYMSEQQEELLFASLLSPIVAGPDNGWLNADGVGAANGPVDGAGDQQRSLFSDDVRYQAHAGDADTTMAECCQPESEHNQLLQQQQRQQQQQHGVSTRTQQARDGTSRRRQQQVVAASTAPTASHGMSPGGAAEMLLLQAYPIAFSPGNAPLVALPIEHAPPDVQRNTAAAAAAALQPARAHGMHAAAATQAVASAGFPTAHLQLDKQQEREGLEPTAAGGYHTRAAAARRAEDPSATDHVHHAGSSSPPVLTAFPMMEMHAYNTRRAARGAEGVQQLQPPCYSQAIAGYERAAGTSNEQLLPSSFLGVDWGGENRRAADSDLPVDWSIAAAKAVAAASGRRGAAAAAAGMLRSARGAQCGPASPPPSQQQQQQQPQTRSRRTVG